MSKVPASVVASVVIVLSVVSVGFGFFGKAVYQGTTYTLTIPRDHTKALLTGGGKEWYAIDISGYRAGMPEFLFELNVGSPKLTVKLVTKPLADAYQVYEFDGETSLETLFRQ